LFILLGHSATFEQPLTLKELFHSLNHSERGVRYVLDQFVDGGWCEIIGNEQDRRFRHVVATEQLITRLREYENFVIEIYSRHLKSV
jgi:DNA-binding MarR family transcriptional regulator